VKKCKENSPVNEEMKTDSFDFVFFRFAAVHHSPNSAASRERRILMKKNLQK
jgi:hypothetical protein